MGNHSDQRFVEGLLNNDNQLIDEIYRRFAPNIRYQIQQRGGSEDDAADIFQESLIDIYNQAKFKGLQLTCPFEPFLLLVCKRKWMNEVKKRGLHPVTKSSDDLSDYGEDVFALAEQAGMKEDRINMFLRYFGELGEKCREIIKLSLSGERQEKVAEMLGVTYGYLRKKKSECMATLLLKVKENPDHGNP